MGILEWLNDNLPNFSINKPKENPELLSPIISTSLLGSDPGMRDFLRRIKDASDYAFRRWLSEAEALHGYRLPLPYPAGQTPPLKEGEKLPEPTHPLAYKII